jgi:hypothetical protein
LHACLGPARSQSGSLQEANGQAGAPQQGSGLL